MSQHDLVVDNASGITVRLDINQALQALGSMMVGTTPPSPTYPCELWADISTGKIWIRNSANTAWLQFGLLDTAGGGFLPITGGALAGPGNLSVAGTLGVTGVSTLAAVNSANLGVTGTLTVSGSATLGGPLSVTAGGGTFTGPVNVSGAAGTTRALAGMTAGVTRWQVVVAGNVTEGGSASGSDFAVSRFNDGGSFVDAPLSITRSNGNASFAHNLAVNGNFNGTTIVASAYLQSAPASGPAVLYLTCPGQHQYELFSNTDGGFYINDNTAGGPNRLTINGAGNATFGGTVAATGMSIAQAGQATLQLNCTVGHNWSILSNTDNALYFYDNNVPATRMIIDGVGTVTIAQGLSVTGQGVFGGYITTAGYVCRAGQPPGAVKVNRFNIDYLPPAQLWIDATNMGNISVSSDYRIKRDIAPLPSMWERAKALNPISYRHQDYTPPNAPLKEDGSAADPLIPGDDVERWGFVAHELQETLIQDAATGVKDQADCIQSPNEWTVIATLTKALQEAMARIEALEAKLATQPPT